MDKSVPRVTVWHHSAEPGDVKTMTLGTDLPIRISYSCKILIFLHMGSTDTRLCHTQVLARFDQNLIFYDN